MLEAWQQEITDKLASLPKDPDRPWEITKGMIRRGKGELQECPLSAIAFRPWYDARANSVTAGSENRRLITTYSADGNTWEPSLYNPEFRAAMLEAVGLKPEEESCEPK
jgi:hypothetical protein